MLSLSFSDYDHISPELHATYNAGFLGLFTGLCYGGFLGSSKKYMEFMERNHATAFESHLMAKKKLQERVVFGFLTTGWKWGWRLGVFSSMYMGISTMISTYRNKYSVTDYIIGGALTGAIYKWKVS